MSLKSAEMCCPCTAHRAPLKQAYYSGETDFKLCTVCGIAFRERFPSDRELVEIYRRAYEDERIGRGDTNQESGRYAAKSYAKFIQRNLWHQGMRVLDYGAGSGELVEQLRELGIEAQGLEFSDNARRYCEETRGFSLLNGLTSTPDGYFDAVSLIEVIEHLTNISDTLAELSRVLKSGGQLLVTTPNRKGLKARVKRGYWREAQKKFHLYLFDRDSLEFHLKESGFVEARNIVFSPLQRPGIKFLVAARLMQLSLMPGTVCMLAFKP